MSTLSSCGLACPAGALVVACPGGRKALFSGNGSTAEAQHLAASLLEARKCDASPGQPRVFDVWNLYICSSETPCSNRALA